MQPLVSVIVPVYKVEKYLSCCLDSLCKQSLKNIEILLIDDASPDRCREICEQYAAKDARFKIFYHTENRGLSVARNLGINQATADYLMFVDSDDWVHKDFCKEAYECAVHYQADLVMFRWQRFSSHGQPGFNIFRLPRHTSSGYKNRLEAMDLLQKGIENNVWSKLYRKELFNDVSFPVGFLCEDMGTTYKIVWKASCIFFLDKVLYYYRYHNGSITSSKTVKFLHDETEMSLQQYHDLVAWGYPPDKSEALLNKIALVYCIKKRQDASDEQYSFFESFLLNSKSCKDNLTWKQKILLYLFKHCRILFELLCILLNKKIC